MPGEVPFFIEGKVVEILPQEIAIVKVSNGNLYHLTPATKGIDYHALLLGDTVRCEITTALTRVLSAMVVRNKE